jgi:hypothetical protein
MRRLFVVLSLEVGLGRGRQVRGLYVFQHARQDICDTSDEQRHDCYAKLTQPQR